MSKFKLNSEFEYSAKKQKKHYNSSKEYDFTDFAYMKRGNAKNELRHLRDTYGF